MSNRYPIKVIEKNGYKFVYNYNNIGVEKYPYMIHIYNSKRTCVYYQPVKKSRELMWTYKYMEKWFNKWLEERK